MKNKLTIACTFIAATSASLGDIEINENLSISGFLDMSYSHSDIDSEVTSFEGSDNAFNLDQVEIDWLFDFDVVTGQIDLEYEEAGDDLEVEQAFITYHFGNDASAITAGRFDSMLAFEDSEPTGLYQFSNAYAFDGLEVETLLPGYNQGVKYTVNTDNGGFFGMAIQDSSVTGSSPDGLGGSDGGYGVEVAAAFTLADGVNAFIGGAYEDNDDEGDSYVVNSYLTYETGAWIFVAELVYAETEVNINGLFGAGDTESLSGLLMANLAYNEQGSVTGRLSFIDGSTETASDDFDYDAVKYTAAHNWAFTDNLLMVLEASYTDADVDGRDADGLLGAAELIFTF